MIPSAAGRARRLWPVVDIDRFDPAPPAANGAQPLRLLFAGTVGLAHGLRTLVDASWLAGGDVVRTTIAGDGADAPHVAQAIRERGAANVAMIGTVPARDIPALYAASDIGAVLLRDLPLFEGALPTKLLEVMAAGRPVLLAARGESAALVASAGAGIVVAPEDPQALAAALRRLHAEPELVRRLGAAGRRYADAHFGARRAADAWVQTLSDAVARRRGAATTPA
jgi:glycosyltransferase involved in cell wall biosynthesis